MITFIYGTYGSGKSTEIVKGIAESINLGRHTFFIVPEQEAVQAERLILEELPSTAQLSLEVLNFSRLYNRICREYGGLSYRYITKPLRHALMWQNLSELSPLLEEYGDISATGSSLSSLMISAINELKSNAVLPADLEKCANNLANDNPLRKKLRDLALIYSSYDRLISEKYSDSSDDISRLYQILCKQDFFKNCDVYIDSFTSFTKAEHKVIDRIFASAANVTVTIPLTSPDFKGNYTLSIENSVSILRRNAKKYGTYSEKTLGKNLRANSEALSYLCNNLWKYEIQGNSHIDPDGSIVLEICDTPYSESEAVSSHILELLRQGARCREIAVIARDISRYRGILEPALEKNGIPYFMSEKTDICSFAPIKLIISALRIRKFNWQKADVIAFVKTGLCGFTQRDADYFEEYVNTWNIRGAMFTDRDWTMNPDGYEPNVSERGLDILSCANNVRRGIYVPLQRFFALLDVSETIGDMCRAVYSFIVDIELEDRIKELAFREEKRDKTKSSVLLYSLYGLILNTLADVGEAMNECETTVDGFLTVIQTVFEHTDMGSIPTSVDEVTIGSASTLRTSDIKYAFVIGLSESVFPAPVNDKGIFSAGEIEQLSSMNVEISSNEKTRSSDELMFVLRAYSIPSDRLFLCTFSSEISGELRLPSLAFSRVTTLFPNITPHKYDGKDFEYLVGSPKSSVSYLRALYGTPKGEALKLSAERYIPKLRGASVSDSFTPTERLSNEILSDKKFEHMTLSFSKFEKYVLCPFNYFCTYELKLRESGKARFKLNHIGTFVHLILEKVLRYAITELDSGNSPTREQISDMINRIVNNYIDELFENKNILNPRLSHLLARMKQLAALVVENLLDEFEHSNFRPAFFELKADGKDNNPQPIVFYSKDGSYSVTFTGVIDRVDVLKKNGEVYIRVIDYKTGSKEFQLEDLTHGMNLQMLLYLCTLCRNKDNGFAHAIGLKDGKTAIPAGMIYLLAKIPTISVEDYIDTENILNAAKEKIGRNGLLLNDEELLSAMNDALSPAFLAGIKKNKDGELEGDALITLEHFEKVFNEMEEVILKITGEMRSGFADARPLIYNDKNPCDYCSSKAICRYIQND